MYIETAGMSKEEIRKEFLRIFSNITHHLDVEDEFIQKVATDAGDFFYGKTEEYLSPEKVREFFCDSYVKMGRPDLKKRR